MSKKHVICIEFTIFQEYTLILTSYKQYHHEILNEKCIYNNMVLITYGIFKKLDERKFIK